MEETTFPIKHMHFLCSQLFYAWFSNIYRERKKEREMHAIRFAFKSSHQEATDAKLMPYKLSSLQMLGFRKGGITYLMLRALAANQHKLG